MARRWIRQQVDKALIDMEWAEHCKTRVGLNYARWFDSGLKDCRPTRLQAAVNGFIPLPFEAELPAIGSTVEVGVIATALDVSRH